MICGVEELMESSDGSPQQIVRATRPSTEEIRDTRDIGMEELMDSSDGSPNR